MKKCISHFLLGLGCLAVACQPEAKVEYPVAQVTIFDSIQMAQRGTRMYTDREPDSLLFSPENRGFNMHQLLSVTSQVGNRYRLFNALPYTFKDVTILLAMPNLAEPIKLMHFTQVPPHHLQEGELPLGSGERIFETVSGKLVGIKDAHLLLPDMYTLLISSSDSMWRKAQTVRSTTRVTFGRYGSGNWGVTLPEHARRYTAVVANMAYLFSSSDFAKALEEYPHVIYDNSKKPIDHKDLQQRILRHGRLNLGVVTGAGIGGLGGGAVFGVRPEYLNRYYKGTLDNWVLEVYAHELGHCLGYSHDSNMTYGDAKGNGFVRVVQAVYKRLLERNELPFPIDPFAKPNVRLEPLPELQPLRCCAHH